MTQEGWEPDYRKVGWLSEDLTTEAEQDAFVALVRQDGLNILRDLLWDLLFRLLEWEQWAASNYSQIEKALGPDATNKIREEAGWAPLPTGG